MIIPRVKRITESNNTFTLPLPLRIALTDEVSVSLKRAAKELFGKVPITFTDRSEADVILRCDPTLSDRTEFYRICSSDGKVTLSFVDRTGGRNALSVLSGLSVSACNLLKLPECRIEDYPDLRFRSFMQDVGRKHVPLADLKAELLLMAKARMNVLHFHFTEYVGFAIALKDFPELKGAAVTGGAQYTEDEIRDLVDYADALCIDVIPEIDLPAHANAITSVYPKLLCQTDDGVPPNGWALCVGNDETYPFLEKLFTAVSELFKSKYFHLGTDEITMPDVNRIPKPVADFCRCRVCRSLGLSDTQLFYRFLRRSYEILRRLGKTLIVWNDQIDVSVDPDLPQDIIIEFWRVAAEGRGPVEGCSMQRFLDLGFNVINANFPDSYIDLYVDYERLKNFNPRKQPASDDKTPGKIIGGDFCAWDVFRHFSHSVPVSTPFFAERYWNTEGKDGGNGLLLSASGMLFGIEGFNIFDYTKKVIDLDESLDIFKPEADLASLSDILRSHTPSDVSESYMQRTYLNLIEMNQI